MGGWGGERVVGKTQSPASPGSLSRETRLHPRPARLPPRPPRRLPLPGILRLSPPAASPCRGLPGRRSPLSSGLPRTREENGQREKFGAGRGGKEAGPAPGPGSEPEGRGGESGAAAQPGHCISPPARRRCCSDFSSPSRQSLPRTAPLVSPSPPGLLPAAAALR